MKHFTVLLLSALFIFSHSLSAEDTKEKSKETKKETLEDLFSGKVEKYEIKDDTKKAENELPEKEDLKKQFQERKMREKLENMPPEDREKFRRALEEKIKNMTEEEKAAFIKKIQKERKKAAKKE